MKTAAHDTLIDLRDRGDVRVRHPLLIAHRGGVIAPAAPEDSLAAIRSAAEHGYDLSTPSATRHMPMIVWPARTSTDCALRAWMASRSTPYMATISSQGSRNWRSEIAAAPDSAR